MSSDHSDTRGLFPLMETSRRGFVMTSLATGFALSVQPAGATIVTDADGLTAGEVKIKVIDGEMPAYRAMPATPHGPHPIVLVIEEVFGVHEHIKDMCRRFAKNGYLAVAPELYSRIGDPSKLTDIKEVIALVNQAPDVQTMADIDAVKIWAGGNGGDPTKVGITGWCRGGRTVWMYAAHNPNIQAGIAWYGPLSGKPTEQMPTNPLDVADKIKVPVLGLYGAQDQSIPVSDVKEMQRRLDADGEECKFIIYPDAGHGFNADYRPSYNPTDAKDAFAQCLDWLRNHRVW